MADWNVDEGPSLVIHDLVQTEPVRPDVGESMPVQMSAIDGGDRRRTGPYEAGRHVLRRDAELFDYAIHERFRTRHDESIALSADGSDNQHRCGVSRAGHATAPGLREEERVAAAAVSAGGSCCNARVATAT